MEGNEKSDSYRRLCDRLVLAHTERKDARAAAWCTVRHRIYAVAGTDVYKRQFCVSAVFIVLVSLLLYEWRKSNTAMCLLTIASALIAIGAAAGLLMTADILPANSVLLPFTVFLVPFFGVTNFMTSTAAAMFLPTAVSVVWLIVAVGNWIHNWKNV